MDCLRCGHRLGGEEVARGRKWHQDCPKVCEDKWCSHADHGEAWAPANRFPKAPAIQPSVVPQEAPEKWLFDAEHNGKKVKVAIPPKEQAVNFIEPCEKIQSEWGDLLVFGTKYGRVLFFPKSKHQVVVIDGAEGKFRLHGSFKRVILTLIMAALPGKGE